MRDSIRQIAESVLFAKVRSEIKTRLETNNARSWGNRHKMKSLSEEDHTVP